MTAVLTPPLSVVAAVVAALQAHDAVVAVGGSGLLAALGLVDAVRDWDVTTDAATQAVEAALADVPGLTVTAAPSGEAGYATRARFLVHGIDHDVDVLVGFALLDHEHVVSLPTRVTRMWRGLPIADPAVWLRAYRLLGRHQRADLLQRWLDGDARQHPSSWLKPAGLASQLRRLPGRLVDDRPAVAPLDCLQPSMAGLLRTCCDAGVPHVVVGALVDLDRILLGHRSPSRRWYPDVWDLPGGHVEQGESEVEALIRELREELDLRVLERDVVAVARLHLGDGSESSLTLSIWRVRHWQGVITNRAPDEHDLLRWFTAGDLAGLAPAHADYPSLLQGVLEGR